MPTETQLSKGAFDTSVFNEMFESTAAGVREGIRAQVETKRNEIFDTLRERVKTAASGLKDAKLDTMIDNMKASNWKEVAKAIGTAATSAMVPKLVAKFGTYTGLAVTAAEAGTAEVALAGTEMAPLLGVAAEGTEVVVAGAEVAVAGAEAAAGAGTLGVLEGLSLSNPWTAVVFGVAAGSYFLFKDGDGGGRGPKKGPAHHLKEGDWVIIDDGFKIQNKYGGMGGEIEYERIRMHSSRPPARSRCARTSTTSTPAGWSPRPTGS